MSSVHLDVARPRRGWSGVRSSATSTSMAGEIDAARATGRSAFTRSMVSMMFAPGWRRMIMSTARLPFVQAATRLFSTSSKTVRHVAEAHRRAVAVGDDERAGSASAPKSWSLAAIVVRAASRRRGCPWAGRRSPAPSAVRTSSSARPTPGERRRIDLHAHRRLLAAADEDLARRPATCAIFCASTVLAASKTCAERQRRRDVSDEDQDRRVGRVDLAVVGPDRQVRRAARRRPR